MTDQFPPFARCAVHKVLHAIDELAQRARTVEVRIDSKLGYYHYTTGREQDQPHRFFHRHKYADVDRATTFLQGRPIDRALRWRGPVSASGFG